MRQKVCSAPDLANSMAPQPTSTMLLARAGGVSSILSPFRRLVPPNLFRTVKMIRFWKGWRAAIANVTKVVLIAIHLALLILLAKCMVFPTDNPREDWWPAQWGVPWYSPSESWANIAARRKALLAEQPRLRHSYEEHVSRRGNGRPPRLKYPILWAAPFFSRSGYGTEAISYIAGLLEYGLVAPEDLWITQAGDGRHPDALDGLDASVRQLLWDQEWHNITKRLSPADRDRPLVVVCHVFPDCWRTAHDDEESRYAVVRLVRWAFKEIKVRMWGVDHLKENGCPCPNEYIKDRVVYRVGRSMFETEKLPAPLVAYSHQLDEVLVPSRFSVDSFSASGIPAAKLHTLPQGINTTLFDPSQHLPIELSILKGSQVVGRYRSYSQGVPGTGDQPGGGWSTVGAVERNLWEARKGWDILLKGYFNEFSAETDNVELHIVTHAFGAEVDNFRTFMRDQIKGLLNVTDDEYLDTRLPRIYVYDKYIPDSMYPGLYQAMDALVVPTHGEGWGRPQFEAMAMGIPVISTNWSGITAFMDDTTGYPIHVEALVDVVDNSPEAFVWFKEQRWAQPSLPHLQFLMRDVINNRKQAAIKGQAARQRIQEEYSILAVARKALVEILRIEAEVEAIMSRSSVIRLPG